MFLAPYIIMQHKPKECTICKLILQLHFSIFDAFYLFRTWWVHP